MRQIRNFIQDNILPKLEQNENFVPAASTHFLQYINSKTQAAFRITPEGLIQAIIPSTTLNLHKTAIPVPTSPTHVALTN
jgi:hypothetical protein